MCKKYLIVICVTFLLSQTHASPASSIDTAVDEMRSLCNDQNDAFSCIKYKALNFLNNIYKQDSFKVCISVKNNRLPLNFLFYFILLLLLL